MRNKKIDKLFQEKFKDFEELPDEKVWSSIEASLDKKKKSRRILPIWWRLGGVAAALALLFYVVNPFDKNEGSTIVTETNENQEKNTPLNTSEGVEVFTNDAEVVTTTNTNNKNEGEDSEHNTITEAEKINFEENAVASSKNAQPDSESKDVFNSIAATSNSSEQAIAAKINEANVVTENVNIPEENIVDALVVNPEAQNSTNPVNEENIAEEVVAVNEVKEEEAQKKSIFDEIEDVEDEVVENSSSKWSVGPSVAPVYYIGLGNGSPIDSDFIANSKSGDVNLSYGIVVSYELSKKLTVRSGLHRVDYGYNTNDITFSSSFGSTANGIDNVDLANSSRNIIVESKFASQQSFSVDALSEVSVQRPVLDGKMSQQLGYLEVPVELNYALVDKKFGLNLIGGFSSLLLMDNFITLESDGLVTEMGEANNINTLNFSTNVGFGLQYKVTPKTQFSVEPMFKYHLNTFNRVSGDFQPFSVGVYSGLKIKF